MAEIETLTVQFPSNGHTTSGYLAKPQGDGPFPGVIVIQEWWGLDAHIKEVAERFAREGFVALAPDLFHGKVTSEPDEARKLVMGLDRERAMRELDATAAYLQGQPYLAGTTVGAVGFCLGGGLSLMMGIRSQRCGAAVIFYGGNPSPLDQVQDLSCPVLGLYGEADQGIPPARVNELETTLHRYGKEHELHIYPEAPHAFFNDQRASYRPEAAADAWRRTLRFFRAHLGAAAPAAVS
ncbi:MAG: dienelactone hydrolase family protein [Chloroflexi bacterium]|nr:dienelactone hydrolase family protein [Chloroflexota bacterium]